MRGYMKLMFHTALIFECQYESKLDRDLTLKEWLDFVKERSTECFTICYVPYVNVDIEVEVAAKPNRKIEDWQQKIISENAGKTSAKLIAYKAKVTVATVYKRIKTPHEIEEVEEKKKPMLRPVAVYSNRRFI